MSEYSDRYKVDVEGKLDVEFARIYEEYWLLPPKDKIEFLTILQSWINKQMDDLLQ
jgi:hypothetical protein